MKVLVTGGAGYIGSHTVLEMLQAGDEVVVLDNLYNASPEALQRVQRLTGKEVQLLKAVVTTWGRAKAWCVLGSRSRRSAACRAKETCLVTKRHL